jgi:hypothetical protein
MVIYARKHFIQLHILFRDLDYRFLLKFTNRERRIAHVDLKPPLATLPYLTWSSPAGDQ